MNRIERTKHEQRNNEKKYDIQQQQLQQMEQYDFEQLLFIIMDWSNRLALGLGYESCVSFVVAFETIF